MLISYSCWRFRLFSVQRHQFYPSQQSKHRQQY